MAPGKAASARRTKASTGDDDSAAEAASVRRARILVFVVLAAMSSGGIAFLADAILKSIPDLPSRTDVEGLRVVLSSGQPAIVLCENKTTLNAAGKVVNAAASAVGASSLRLECDDALYTKLRLERGWNPVMFAAAHGTRPVQLAPTADAEALAKLVKPMFRNRVLHLESDARLDRCVKERSGGCLILYSSAGGASQLQAAIAGIADSHRTVQFAVLPSRERILKAAPGSAPAEAIRAAVAAAKELAGPQPVGQDSEDGDGAGGNKPFVLLAVRRLPPQLADGESGQLLITATPGAGPVSAAAVGGALERSASALAALRAAAAIAEGETGSAEGEEAAPLDKEAAAAAAVARVAAAAEAHERALQPTGSVVASRPEVSIAHAPRKQKAKAAPAAPRQRARSSDGGSGAAGAGSSTDPRMARRAARAEKRDKQRAAAAVEEEAAVAAERAAAAAAAAAEAEVDPAERARRQLAAERARREAMAAEEAASAFFAEAAVGDAADADEPGQEQDDDEQEQAEEAIEAEEAEDDDAEL